MHYASLKVRSSLKKNSRKENVGPVLVRAVDSSTDDIELFVVFQL
jgi:hypothetical protein